VGCSVIWEGIGTALEEMAVLACTFGDGYTADTEAGMVEQYHTRFAAVEELVVWDGVVPALASSTDGFYLV